MGGEAILPEPIKNKDVSTIVKTPPKPQVEAPDTSGETDSIPAAKPDSALGSGPSKRQKLAMAIGAGAVGIAGLGAAALGLRGSGVDNVSTGPLENQTPAVEVLPYPSDIHLGAFSKDQVQINSSNSEVVPVDKVVSLLGSGRAQGEMLIPLSFNPGTGVDMQKFIGQLPDGTPINSIGFKNITEETDFISPISGKVGVAEMDMGDANHTKYKALKISTADAAGNGTILLVIIPEDTHLEDSIPVLKNISEDAGKDVRLGEKILKLKPGSTLPGDLGLNLEIRSLQGKAGDPSSFKQTKIDLASDVTSGKAIHIN